MAGPWWRLPMCWTGWCGAVQSADDTHIWAECVTCGKIIALISREAVRRYIQAEESDAKFIQRMKDEGRIPQDWTPALPPAERGAVEKTGDGQ